MNIDTAAGRTGVGSVPRGGRPDRGLRVLHEQASGGPVTGGVVLNAGDKRLTVVILAAVRRAVRGCVRVASKNALAGEGRPPG
jgi:hypothetical protein